MAGFLSLLHQCKRLFFSFRLAHSLCWLSMCVCACCFLFIFFVVYLFFIVSFVVFLLCTVLLCVLFSLKTKMLKNHKQQQQQHHDYGAVLLLLLSHFHELFFYYSTYNFQCRFLFVAPFALLCCKCFVLLFLLFSYTILSSSSL